MLDNLKHEKLNSKDYEQQLASLQKLLYRLQISLFLENKRAVILFEGVDAAGKGGAIHRMLQAMDPRGYRVYPVGPPTQTEAERHYLQRFWRRIPKAGQVAIFDRSWYGRVLVERVDHLTAKTIWKRAYREINEFERLLADDGIVMIKILLHITKEEQRERLLNRLETPHKQWKLMPSDLRAFSKYADYHHAFEDMLEFTSTPLAPWTVIAANHKKYTRVEVLKTVVNAFEEVVSPNLEVHSDDELIEEAHQVLRKQ